MKRIFTLLLLFLVASQIIAQETVVKYEPKTIIENRQIYLNSGSNASFGGKSREIIKIDLPPNTIEWYYSFSTSLGKSGIKTLMLATQLVVLYSSQTYSAGSSALAQQAIKTINIPSGSSGIDIFLCDRNNIDKFINKADLNLLGGTFSYALEGSANNTKQATVRIDDITKGTVYLGLRNPSSFEGVNISIEVVAIVKNTSLVEKSDEQKKAELYGGLGWKEYENGNYAKCIEYSDKANEFYKWGWVNANKALSLLVSGKQSEAMDVYIDAITLIKKQPNPSYVFSEVVKDLDNLIRIIPNLAGASNIRELIVLEIK